MLPTMIPCHNTRREKENVKEDEYKKKKKIASVKEMAVMQSSWPGAVEGAGWTGEGAVATNATRANTVTTFSRMVVRVKAAVSNTTECKRSCSQRWHG